MPLPLSKLLYILFMSALAVSGGTKTRSHSFEYAGSKLRPSCAACHHPHQPEAAIPRWQGREGRPGRLSFYQTRPNLPNETSLMCLTCHDGAIAAEIHSGNRATTASQLGRSVVDVNIMIRFPLGTHPVGIAYTPRNNKLVPRRAVEADGLIRLPDGRVECVSCHDPHGTSGHKSLLVKSNRRSALCLSCHRL